MSELLDNARIRKARLKELILRLHGGEPEATVRRDLLASLAAIPYGEVVEVEQELIAEGLPEEEILRLCDAHSAVLHGQVDLSGMRAVPPGHPVDLLRRENAELLKLVAHAEAVVARLAEREIEQIEGHVLRLRGTFNSLMDVDKHYQRKELLLFTFLEQKGITGPPKVMWGKHDEIRAQLEGARDVLAMPGLTLDDFLAAAEIVLLPAVRAVADMTAKEEQILLPMALDALTERDWYEIARQSLEIGFCLYDPPTDWRPDWAAEDTSPLGGKAGDHVRLPTGGFTVEELLAILNTLPVDMTFVDRNDKVKYFSQGTERIFQRSRAILNRDVRYCHPPASAHIVDKIVEDFRSGAASRAPFWIQKGEQFVHIEYFALRNEQGEYLGTLEVSQNVAGYRALEGEQRILAYRS
ncbi:MAG: DUF438 domain-containing protein [Thermoanaerobaculia bacterium]|nr:DUF438 domain-containing protein [Thermoanaerobaculia bacterium]